VKAKINNSGVVALGMCFFSLVLLNCIYMRWIGYTQTLRPGVKASFGVALDTQKLNDPSPVGPSHKVRFPFFFCTRIRSYDFYFAQVGVSFVFDS
jgi:voltage-dependent anion channel protein 2